MSKETRMNQCRNIAIFVIWTFVRHSSFRLPRRSPAKAGASSLNAFGFVEKLANRVDATPSSRFY
jgi:hypothetical protein